MICEALFTCKMHQIAPKLLNFRQCFRVLVGMPPDTPSRLRAFGARTRASGAHL